MCLFAQSLRRNVAALALAIGLGQAAAVPTTAQGATADPGTLRSVVVLFRHGVISPKYALPKIKSEWPMGYEQLTIVGMREMYEEGRALRRKYVDKLGLISGTFEPTEVYVRASGADRAVQSARMITLGLFPEPGAADPLADSANAEAALLAAAARSPVPIHAGTLENDPVMRPWTNKAACTRYRKFVDSLERTQIYVAQAERHRDFLLRIAALTGVGEGKPPASILYEVNEIYEPLTSMVQHGMPLPPELSASDMQQMSDLADWNYHHQFLGKAVGRLTGGSFVGEVIENFATVANAKSEARKLYIYSGHQRSILGVESALGLETARTEGPLFRGRVPALTAHYAIELHEPSPGAFAVEVKFVSPAGEQSLEIPECGAAMCPFDRFKAIMATVVPTNWRQECR